MSQLQRNMQTIESLLANENPASSLREICDKFELQNLAYFGLPNFGSLQTPPRLKVTYEGGWVQHYKQKRYASADPVLLEGIRTGRSFDWDALKLKTPESRNFFGEAAEFGVGVNGITFPITGQGNPIALVSFTSLKQGQAWRGFVDEFQQTLQLISLSLHENIWQREDTDLSGDRLSERESECLKWAAIGKTAFETSIIIGISERTVRHHLEMSRKKLDAANITHAVVKAINANLLGMNF